MKQHLDHGSEADRGKILTSRIRLDPPKERENLASFLRDGLRRNSSRTLLVDAKKNTQWTGSEILDKVERIATGLIRLAKLEPAQVVLTICDHTDHEILLALGVIFAGGALYGTSPEDGYGEELNSCMMVKPSVIVANSNLHQMVRKLKQQVPGMEQTQVIWIDDPTATKADPNNNNGNGNDNSNNNNNNNTDQDYQCELRKQDQVIQFDDLLEGPRESELVDEVIGSKIESKTQNVTFLLTSGSTGKPKVVPNTHEELVWALQSMSCSLKYPVGSSDPAETNDGEAKIILPISENSVLAGDLPLDHGAGLNTMFLSLVAGSKLVILPSYQEDAFWQGVHDYRISVSIASTTFAYKLLLRLKHLMSLGQHKRWDLSSFEFLTCCGSKLAFQDVVREISSAYPHLRIGQAYGCTEMGFISILAGEDCREHLNSVGHLVPGFVAKVIDIDTGKLMGPNERGQLLLSSMTKFKGYKCMPGEDAAAQFANCHDDEGIFYKTGDLVHYDEEQRLYIHGRLKDTLYLMEDWKLLPIELEMLVNQHPLVEYSAVVGVPDPDLPGYDTPKAFVKLISTQSKEFRELTSEKLREKLLAKDWDFIGRDIYNFFAERTCEPKHLRGGVRILEVFPRNGLLAKIDRKVLKQMD